jgi:hypothetical protein
MAPNDVLTWTPHIKVSWGGTIGNPPLEIWNNSVRFHVPGAAPSEQGLQDIANAAGPYISEWISRGASAIRQAVLGTYVKAVWVESTGKQRDTNTAQADLVPAASYGTLAAGGIWPQTYVLTFRTAVKRGRAHSGRIYPPYAGNGAQAGSPYLAQGDAQGMANSGAVLLTNLRLAVQATAIGSYPSVFSPGSANRGTAPMYNPITAVVVDRVADIMHSRSNRVPRLESQPEALG